MRSQWLQAGISMVQGMVISSVLAGSALIATRMITTQKMAIKSAETKDHILQLHKMIFSTLQNRQHCLTTLSSVVAGLTPGTPQTFAINSIRTNDGDASPGTPMAVNTGGSYNEATTYMNGHVRINSMSLTTTTDLGNPQPLVINYLRLEKGQNTRTKSGFGGKSISKTVWIRFQREIAFPSSLSGCYAVEMGSEDIEEYSQATCLSKGAPYYWDATALRCKITGAGNEDLNKQFCEGLGTGGSLFTWNPTRNACSLKDNICGAKQVFEGIDVNGSAICRSINDYLPFLIKPGTNPCNGTKTVVAIVRDAATNKVSIECY